MNFNLYVSSLYWLYHVQICLTDMQQTCSWWWQIPQANGVPAPRLHVEFFRVPSWERREKRETEPWVVVHNEPWKKGWITIMVITWWLFFVLWDILDVDISSWLIEDQLCVSPRSQPVRLRILCLRSCLDWKRMFRNHVDWEIALGNLGSLWIFMDF